MAWPFPHGAPGKGAGENCTAKFERTVACREPWQRAMQGGAGWDGAVVVAVGMLQVLSWVMGRRWAEERWADSFWGRLVVRLFGKRDEGVNGGRDGARPLLTGREEGEGRVADVEEGEGGEGDGGFRYGGTDNSQRSAA